MKRREFILWSGLGISAITIPTYYYKFYTPKYNQLLNEPEMLSHIWDETTIDHIGKLYLKQFSHENSVHKLAKLLSDYSSIDSTSTIEMLRQQITVDYRQENTVLIDGWILSRTEARQCALFSLTQTK